MTVYWNRADIPAGEPGAFPAVLAIGDSWFWYPLPDGFNLLEQLSRDVLKYDYRHIFSLGKVGAKLQEFVDGQHAHEFQFELRALNVQYYSAVFISAAGNDAVDYSLALAGDCSGRSTPEQCFDEARFDDLMRSLSGWLGRMIHDIRWACRGRPPERQPYIFVNCYDYAPASGVAADFAGLPLPFGPWLKPAMDAAGVAQDAALRRGIVRRLMDRLHQTFSAHEGETLRVVDCRGCLDPLADWANELHPNTRGFGKLAAGPWRRALQEAGFANG